MLTYRVLLERKRSAYRHIEIQAHDAEEAERKALALVSDEPSAFDFSDDTGDEDATVVETETI